jgi:predicted DNA-binding transcriptional regulator AlpA
MKKVPEPKTAPTGLRREDAAMHCGISPSYFDKMVEARNLPAPRLIGPSIKIWMRQELDSALFSLPTLGEAAELNNPCDRLLEG